MSLSTGETTPILARWNEPTITVCAGPYLTLEQIQNVTKDLDPTMACLKIMEKCRKWGHGVRPFLTLPRSQMMGDSKLVVIFPLASHEFPTREVEFTSTGLQFVTLPEADDDSRASARLILDVGPEDDISHYAAQYRKISAMNSVVGDDLNGVAKDLLQRLALLFDTTPKEIPIGFIQDLKERELYESNQIDSKAGSQDDITR